jgi:CheY-like chemotaxis protein
MSPGLRFEVIPVSEISFKSDPAATNESPVILVVDDEKVIADTLSIILSKNGFRVLTAYNAEMALELASTTAPALLVSDVMMGPGMDGAQLAITLRKGVPDCKVILFSGHAAARDLLERASEIGHDFTLLTKPLHPADLLLRIRQAFAAHPTLAEA